MIILPYLFIQTYKLIQSIFEKIASGLLTKNRLTHLFKSTLK